MTVNLSIPESIGAAAAVFVQLVKMVCGVLFAIIVLGSLAAAAGHAIPYLPRLPLDQGHGIAIAALAYYLGR